jgi:hypothetical protein
VKLLRNSLLTALGLVVVGLALSLTYQKGVEAQLGSTPVRVVNTATAPALARDVDRRAPYQVSRSAERDPNTNVVSATLPTVPAGKRLVIEHLSVFFEVGKGQQATCVVQAPDATAGSAELFFPLSLQGQGSLNDTYAGSQRVLIFVSAGNGLTVTCLQNSVGGFGQMSVNASGYLVDE